MRISEGKKIDRYKTCETDLKTFCHIVWNNIDNNVIPFSGLQKLRSVRVLFGFFTLGFTIHYIHNGHGNVSTKASAKRCCIYGTDLGGRRNGHTGDCILGKVMALYPAGNISSKYFGFLVYMVSNWIACALS